MNKPHWFNTYVEENGRIRWADKNGNDWKLVSKV